jgi:hypothetical protein
MNRFESRNGSLFINSRKVLRGWESWTGWYWFAIEKVCNQDSVIEGKVFEDDTIWYGLVQGFEEKWGNFSQAEMESLRPRVWRIPKKALPWSGRRCR